LSFWQGRRVLVISIVFVLTAAAPSLAAGVHARLDLSSRRGRPCPTDAHDRWTLFRYDLVRLARPTAPANPHTFLTNIGNPAVADLAIAAQMQIGIFFASDGAVVVDPDTLAGPFFEVPISAGQIPLMEDLNF